MKLDDIRKDLGLGALDDGDLAVHSPTDGALLGRVASTDADALDEINGRAARAFMAWRELPAPRRGELVRLLAVQLRRHKQALGALVTLECGKIREEGLGEVQEMIDICDFAVGLSRQLHGLTIASERPSHLMRETWHPLGPVGIISAFNFPVAVWAWNAALALVCGDSIVWKPSPKTPLCALACQHLLECAMAEFGDAPEGLSQLVMGHDKAARQMAGDARLPLLSATGSSAMGRALAPLVAERFGRSILELGGNNAIIVTESADLPLALRAIVFGAVGTAGQRCTTTRRLLVHQSLHADLLARLKKVFAGLRVGDPMEPDTVVGPLIDRAAWQAMEAALADAPGPVTGGERLLAERHPDAFYARPALVETAADSRSIQGETFAPILYVTPYSDLDRAIAIHNDVPQGLSSAIFTNDLRQAAAFMSVSGSDCGIANVNIGTSGAEIGGAFGGEKETGGGRESGSDCWKYYMRRQTSTVNYSADLPLAQGIKFDF